MRNNILGLMNWHLFWRVKQSVLNKISKEDFDWLYNTFEGSINTKGKHQDDKVKLEFYDIIRCCLKHDTVQHSISNLVAILKNYLPTQLTSHYHDLALSLFYNDAMSHFNGSQKQKFNFVFERLSRIIDNTERVRKICNQVINTQPGSLIDKQTADIRTVSEAVLFNYKSIRDFSSSVDKQEPSINPCYARGC